MYIKREKNMKRQNLFRTVTTRKEKEKEEKREKKPYQQPVFEPIRIKVESFFCTSVSPDAQNSSTEAWDADTSHEGGAVCFGHEGY